MIVDNAQQSPKHNCNADSPLQEDEGDVTMMTDLGIEAFSSSQSADVAVHDDRTPAEKQQLLHSNCELSGRRIVKIGYFFKCLQEIGKHKPFGCGFGDMEV